MSIMVLFAAFMNLSVHAMELEVNSIEAVSTQQIEKNFLDAVKNVDCDALAKMCKNTYKINTDITDSSLRTPIGIIVDTYYKKDTSDKKRLDCLTMIEMLLDYGIDPKVHSYDFDSGIGLSVMSTIRYANYAPGSYDLVILLTQYGLDVERSFESIKLPFPLDYDENNVGLDFFKIGFLLQCDKAQDFFNTNVVLKERAQEVLKSHTESLMLDQDALDSIINPPDSAYIHKDDTDDVVKKKLEKLKEYQEEARKHMRATKKRKETIKKYGGPFRYIQGRETGYVHQKKKLDAPSYVDKK